MTILTMMGLTPVRFEDFIGCVSGVMSGFFVPIGVESNCNVVTFVMFAPIGVDLKVSRLVKMFWISNS